jgi:signal transduction histidine kinase
MADADVPAPQGPPEGRQPRPAIGDVGRETTRYARRFFWPGGLSSRLLIVTVLFVAVVSLLILPWSLALYEANWLDDRLRAAELASLAVDASSSAVSDKLSNQLLNGAGVLSVAVYSEGVQHLVLAPPRSPRTPYLVDLRDGVSLDMLAAPFQTLFSGRDRLVRVRAQPRFFKGDFVEIVVSDAPLKTAIEGYLLRLSAIAAVMAGLTGGLIYLLLNALFVQPMQRITQAMERFRVDPDDPLAGVRLSGRRDEIGRAEAELDRMQADLRTALNSRARLAALGEAVAKINHDLRNMLTSAQIASERLALSGDPKVAQALPRLERALDRAIKLASDVLAYGRSEESAPNPIQIDLAGAIAEAAEDAGLSPHGVRLVSKVGVKAKVHADPEQLHRILVNLLRNGREAITSRTDGDKRSHIEVSFETRNGAGVIRIADSGPGIPDRILARLFQPFSGSSRPGGAGLGLAISRELAQGHGGDLVLAGNGPDGAVFELRLPEG